MGRTSVEWKIFFFYFTYYRKTFYGSPDGRNDLVLEPKDVGNEDDAPKESNENLKHLREA